MMNEALKRKQIYILLTNEGSATKSDIADKICYAFESKGLKIAKYDGDNDHRSLYKKYGKKDKHGNLTGLNDALDGCYRFDIETDNDIIVESIQTHCDYVLLDLPARSIDITQRIFGDLDLFYTAFENNDAELNVIIPVVSDKSMTSIKDIYATISDVTLTNPINLILVKNTGYMKHLGTYAEVSHLYAELMEIIASNQQVNIIEVELKTIYDNKGVMAGLLKENKLGDILNQKHGIVVKTLLGQVQGDVERLYQALVK
jgi:hypothetical protein